MGLKGQGPARGLVLGQGALGLRPGWLAHGPHRPAERAARALGEAGIFRPDRGPERLHPPGERRRPGREAGPGRPAQGRGDRHRREDRPAQPAPHGPGDDLQVRPAAGRGAAPRAETQRAGRLPGHVADIPAEAVDEGFAWNPGGLIRRLAAETPARRVPSPMERRVCEITQADCPDRLAEGPSPEGVAGGFQHEPRRRGRERWKP